MNRLAVVIGFALALATAARAAPSVRDDLWSMEPAITSDGTTIVVPYQAEDGARASPNLELRYYTRAGVMYRRDVVRTIGQCGGAECPPGELARVQARERAAWRTLSSLRRRRGLVPMTEIVQTTDEATHAMVPGLSLDLAVDGTLTITRKGARAAQRLRTGWRTQPTPAQDREMQRRLDAGELPCFNPAEIGDIWMDDARRAAVIQIRFHGNDSCWEPDSKRVVVTW